MGPFRSDSGPYGLTPWRREDNNYSAIKKILACYETRRFITMVTRAHQ